MVSVSKTISRMASLNTRRQAETIQDIAHLGPGFFQRAGSVDDKVGAGLLFFIRLRPGQDLAEFFVGQSDAGHHPSRCSSVAAETTITLSNAALPPVSNSKGMSNKSAGAVPCSTMNRVRS